MYYRILPSKFLLASRWIRSVTLSGQMICIVVWFSHARVMLDACSVVAIDTECFSVPLLAARYDDDSTTFVMNKPKTRASAIWLTMLPLDAMIRLSGMINDISCSYVNAKKLYCK